MKFDYPYTVPREEVRVRLEALGDYLYNRHGIRIEWASDDKVRFSGKYLVVTVEGEMTIDDGVVHFRGKDPGMLWRKKAMQYLQGKLGAYLDPNTPPASLPRDKQ